jgi:lipoate-protein ligase A
VTETWRLITTFGADPAFNMGLDEALLLSSDAPPTVRFYTWRPETLSIGYFQKLSDIAGHERARRIVRRITGGGAIHHANELTFSISAPQSHRLYAGPIAPSYVRVHDAIRAALRELSVESELRGERALASDVDGTGMCFHHSTPLDIAWAGKDGTWRKGVGSAQRRSKGRVLHHGSIKLGTSPLEGRIATLKEHVPTLDVHTLAQTLRTSFERAFEVTLETTVPVESERVSARELGKRYVDARFIALRA